MSGTMAFAWMFWRRHRWLWLIVSAYLAFIVGFSALLPEFAAAMSRFLDERFPGRYVAAAMMLVLILPMTHVCMFVAWAFCFGHDATEVQARRSCFPAPLFTLPVRTRDLVLVPLLGGSAAVVLLWLLTALILPPWQTYLAEEALLVPMWWPALLAATGVAWLQALLWYPFGIRGLRPACVGVLTVVLIALPQVLYSWGASESTFVAILMPSLFAGWLVAYRGVALARHGDVPDWEGVLRWLERHLPWRRSSHPFSSSAEALGWLEWRRRGKALPVLVAVLIPSSITSMYLGKLDQFDGCANGLVSSLLTPVLFAGLASMTRPGRNPWVKERHALGLFEATLPVQDSFLLARKLKTGAVSTLVTWGLWLATIPLSIVLTGNLPEIGAWWDRAAQEVAPAQIVVGLLAVAALLVLWTWKRYANGLFAGLLDKEWIQGAFMMAGWFGITIVWGFAAWISRQPEARESARVVLPWVLGGYFLCRLLIALWILRLGVRRGLVAPGTAVSWVGSLALIAVVLFGALAWALPAHLIPWPYAALVVLWVLPGIRLAAEPLLLARIRHR